MCCSLIIQENVRFQYMTGFCHKPYQTAKQLFGCKQAAERFTNIRLIPAVMIS